MATLHGYPIKRAVIDVASSGNNTIVAAHPGAIIRVVQCFLVAAGTVTVTWQSGAGGTAITGGVQLVAQTGYVLNMADDGWFETASGVLLNLNLSANISVDGALAYILAVP